MTPKKNRLDKKIVDKIFKEGKFVNSPLLTFKYLYNKDILDFRISFIVPKTVSKKAVIRNLLRRRGYYSLNKLIKIVPRGTEGVIIFNKKSTDFFCGIKNKKNNPILNLEKEISIILNKI